ncbi:hypothetical protein FVEG_16493 [Fusarium verticillioides 7600]|uniref:Uncharacterized protein n=1 Tax=Gibberella moniliformis (strain M3125 / FGSC 7600) TaxID=334819 RepID=W7MPC9_GIBM7|nr:hypothetical protein FVEG_16493 [Fusarium verticillioides 7600]EWG49450.1 hypothetical protein FVEG_16493 [Fusarium verticillioides 7600]
MHARLGLTLTALVGLQRLYACIPPPCRSSKKPSLSSHTIHVQLPAIHTQFLPDPDPVIVDANLNILLSLSLSLQASPERDKYLCPASCFVDSGVVGRLPPVFALSYQCFVDSVCLKPVRFDVYPYILASSAGCPTPWIPSHSSSSTHEALQSY